MSGPLDDSRDQGLEELRRHRGRATSTWRSMKAIVAIIRRRIERKHCCAHSPLERPTAAISSLRRQAHQRGRSVRHAGAHGDSVPALQSGTHFTVIGCRRRAGAGARKAGRRQRRAVATCCAWSGRPQGRRDAGAAVGQAEQRVASLGRWRWSACCCSTRSIGARSRARRRGPAGDQAAGQGRHDDAAGHP